MKDQKMQDADMKARLKELYLPPAKDFVTVDVPEMRFVMIDVMTPSRRRRRDWASHPPACGSNGIPKA
jgi:hypothetical protein